MTDTKRREEKLLSFDRLVVVREDEEDRKNEFLATFYLPSYSTCTYGTVQYCTSRMVRYWVECVTSPWSSVQLVSILVGLPHQGNYIYIAKSGLWYLLYCSVRVVVSCRTSERLTVYSSTVLYYST